MPTCSKTTFHIHARTLGFAVLPRLIAKRTYVFGQFNLPLIPHTGIEHLHTYQEIQALSEERVWFSWLPTFHDMGLIQGTLAPFMAGWRAGYCSPVTFIRNPLIWLRLMSKERSQMTAAPDFAYRLCTRRW